MELGTLIKNTHLVFQPHIFFKYLYTYSFTNSLKGALTLVLLHWKLPASLLLLLTSSTSCSLSGSCDWSTFPQDIRKVNSVLTCNMQKKVNKTSVTAVTTRTFVSVLVTIKLLLSLVLVFEKFRITLY